MTYFNSLKVAIDSSVIEIELSIISVSFKLCWGLPSQIDFAWMGAGGNLDNAQK